MRQAPKIALAEDGATVLKNRTSPGVKWRYIGMLIDIEAVVDVVVDELELVELLSVIFIESMLR